MANYPTAKDKKVFRVEINNYGLAVYGSIKLSVLTALLAEYEDDSMDMYVDMELARKLDAVIVVPWQDELGKKWREEINKKPKGDNVHSL